MSAEMTSAGTAPGGGNCTGVHASLTDHVRAQLPCSWPIETRAAGSLGVNFARVEQDPHELVDEPTADHVLQLIRRIDKPGAFSLGNGWVPVDLGAGSAALTPPGTEVAYRAPGKHELLAIGLPAAPIARALGEAAPDPGRALGSVYETPFVDRAVFELGHRMWGAAVGGGAAAGLLVDQVALAIVAMLLDRAGERPLDAAAPSERIVGRVRDYVEANLAEPLGLEDLASVACLSPWHFHRAFRDMTGNTPHRYVQRRRIERAKALIAAGLPLAQIAHGCGFASQSHFGEVFKAHTGATPGRYRSGVRE